MGLVVLKHRKAAKAWHIRIQLIFKLTAFKKFNDKYKQIKNYAARPAAASPMPLENDDSEVSELYFYGLSKFTILCSIHQSKEVNKKETKD